MLTIFLKIHFGYGPRGEFCFISPLLNPKELSYSFLLNKGASEREQGEVVCFLSRFKPMISETESSSYRLLKRK